MVVIIYHACMGSRDLVNGSDNKLCRFAYHSPPFRVNVDIYLNGLSSNYCNDTSSAAESGYTPGILYQLSKIYKPQELGFRIAILLFMAALSSIVSGPIGYIATKMDGKLGLYGWQYLFILEGAPTVLLALLSYWVLFDDVSDVRWLSQEQKLLQKKRMVLHIGQDVQESVSWCTLKIVLSDKKTWLFSSVFFLASINVTSIQVFLPIIIHGKLLALLMFCFLTVVE